MTNKNYKKNIHLKVHTHQIAEGLLFYCATKRTLTMMINDDTEVEFTMCYTHIYIHTYIYTYTVTHTHTHTHTFYP